VRGGERELRQRVARLARRGLVLLRRGPDGGAYMALSNEGWELLRATPREELR